MVYTLSDNLHHPNDLMWLEIWDSSLLSLAIIPRLSMNFSLYLYASIFNAFGLIDCCKVRNFNLFWVSWPPTSYFMLGYIRKFNQANDVRHVIIRSTSWKKSETHASSLYYYNNRRPHYSSISMPPVWLVQLLFISV